MFTHKTEIVSVDGTDLFHLLEVAPRPVSYSPSQLLTLDDCDWPAIQWRIQNVQEEGA